MFKEGDRVVLMPYSVFRLHYRSIAQNYNNWITEVGNITQVNKLDVHIRGALGPVPFFAILGLEYEEGEEIEVRDSDRDKWRKRTFVSYCPYGAVCVQGSIVDAITALVWRQNRKKQIIIIIDGVEYDITSEKYDQIMKIIKD